MGEVGTTTSRSGAARPASTPRETGSISQQLARYWATASLADVTPASVSAAKRFLLDTLAAGVAGGRESVVQSVVDGIRIAAGTGDAVLWGRGDSLPPAAAALVNGTAAHALELDDFGGCGHSGAVVVPAICALAAVRRATGRDMLLATIAGYDVASRVLDGSGGYRPHNGRGWHSTGTCGSFGAAAGSAKLLNLSADDFAHALGIAGTFTGGLWAFLADGALVKRFHPGKAAETGVIAALLAQSGLTGPGLIFEAEWGGFYPTYAPGVSTPERVLQRLGEDFHILRSGIKPYACCRTIHSCIDAVLEIVGAAPGRSASVARMIVHGNEQTRIQFSRTEIGNLLEAQFSMPYCLAVAAESGRATIDQFVPLRVDDPEIRRLMSVTSIRTDRVLGPTDYPALEVVFADGRSAYKDVAFAKGAPEAPLSDAELIDKAMTLLAPALGQTSARRLVETILDLEQVQDFSEVLRLLVPASQGEARCAPM
jgi:2-methylcitrate dehydratase PrpD